MYVAKSDGRSRYALYEPRLHSASAQRQRARDRAASARSSAARSSSTTSRSSRSRRHDPGLRGARPLASTRSAGCCSRASSSAIAEESGLIVEIGRCVLGQAFRLRARVAGRRSPSAADVGLWVNLAPGEFTNERLVEDLALALTRTRLDPRRLTVEITESSVMPRRAQRRCGRCDRLRELGVAALDRRLRHRLLVPEPTRASSRSSMLKIPKTFVDPLAGEEADTSFVDAILRLADSLGIVTVAEGIEHAAQARRLRDLGCELGQGYVFSRPLRAGDVVELCSAPGGLPAPRLIAAA